MKEDHIMWKKIENYEAYEINEDGVIKRNNKNLKARLSRNGFSCVSLSKKNKANVFYIHELLAKAFIENPHEYNFVNHKDGNKLNNSLTNLKWSTIDERYISESKISSNTLKDFIKKNSFLILLIPTCFSAWLFIGNFLMAVKDGTLNGSEISQLISSANGIETLLLSVIMFAIK